MCALAHAAWRYLRNEQEPRCMVCSSLTLCGALLQRLLLYATGLLLSPCRRVVSMTGVHVCFTRYLVMELVSGGELFDRIVEKGSVRRSLL